MRLRKLEVTEAIRARLHIVQIIEENVDGGGLGLSPRELDYVKAELAEEVIAEMARQEMVRAARVDDVDEAVTRRPVAVVEVELRRKRRTSA